MNSILFLVIGPTGVGKTTIISDIVSRFNNISFLPSYTSRPIREGESEGSPYFFVDRQEFERKIKDQEMVEWKFVHGSNYYGVGKKAIEQTLNSGQNLITDVEVLGAVEIIDHFPAKIISIFVDVQSIDELKNRIAGRSLLSDTEINKRLNRIKLEMLYKHHFDFHVVNDDLEECLQNFRQIIQLSLDISKSHPVKTPDSILHHYFRAIIFNSSNEILLTQRKTPFANPNWSLIQGHVLNNESPEEALQRELAYICPALSQQDKQMILNQKSLAAKKRSLTSHHHYELIYKLSLNLTDFDSENYNIKWVSLTELINYLSADELTLYKQVID